MNKTDQDKLPEFMSNFIDEHPVFIRLYVPVVTTLTFLIMLLSPVIDRWCS